MNWLVWSLLSASFAAMTAILAKLGVTGIDANLATAIRTTVILIFTWMIVLFTGVSGIGQIPGRSWLWLVLSGTATGLSWLCYFQALRVGEASRVAPIDKLSVVLVIVFAAFFLGERITGPKALGVLLMAAGAIVIAAK